MDCCDVDLVFQLGILSTLYPSMVHRKAKEVLGKKYCDKFLASFFFSSFLHVVALLFSQKYKSGFVTPMFRTIIIPVAYWIQYRFMHLFLSSYYPIIYIYTPTRLACLLAKHSLICHLQVFLCSCHISPWNAFCSSFFRLQRHLSRAFLWSSSLPLYPLDSLLHAYSLWHYIIGFVHDLSFLDSVFLILKGQHLIHLTKYLVASISSINICWIVLNVNTYFKFKDNMSVLLSLLVQITGIILK